LIKKEKIENYASIRLDDILREENGLFTVPDNTVPGVEGIQIQGLSSDYVQILVDGVPSVGRLSGNLDLNRFAVSNLERIEIVKGPSSSLYGSSAIGGVINLITKKNFDDKINFHFDQSVGSNKLFDSNILISKKIKNNNISFSYNRLSSNGYDLDNNDGFRTVDPYKNHTFSGVYNADFKNDFALFQSIKFYKQDQNSLNSNNKQAENSSHTKFSKKFKKNIKTELELYYTEFNNDEFLSSGDLSSFFYHKLLKSEIRFFKNLNNNSSLTTGISLENELLNRSLFSGNVKSNLVNAYFQYDKLINNKINFIIGSRFDNHSDYENELSSKLSLKYFLSNSISFSASIGQGFKAPDFRQLYLNFSNSITGYSVFGKFEEINGINRLFNNNQLLNLLIQKNELGGELYPEQSVGLNFAFKLNLQNFTSSINFFRNDIKNLIDTRILATKVNGQNVFGYVNIDKIFTQGIEFNNDISIFENFDINFGYQLLFARDKENFRNIKNGNVYARDPNTLQSIVIKRNQYLGLPNRSRHNINLNLGYKNNIFLRFMYRSKFGIYDTNGNELIDNYDLSIVKPSINFNATYSLKIFKKAMLAITVKNITNYTNTDFLPNISGREYHLKFSYDIN